MKSFFLLVVCVFGCSSFSYQTAHKEEVERYERKIQEEKNASSYARLDRVVNGSLKGEKTKEKAEIKELSCQEKKDSCRTCSAKILVSNPLHKTYDEFEKEYETVRSFIFCLSHRVLWPHQSEVASMRELVSCVEEHRSINLEISEQDFAELKNLERKTNPYSYKKDECLYDLERLDGKIPYSQLMNLHSKCSVIIGKYEGIEQKKREKIRPIKEKIVSEMMGQLKDMQNILEKEQEMDINFMCPICDDWNCERSSGGW